MESDLGLLEKRPTFAGHSGKKSVHKQTTVSEGFAELIGRDPRSGHLDKFRKEFDKVKRSLVFSIDRERTYLSQIKELKEQVAKANQQLLTRGVLVSSLEKQVKQLDDERQRAIRSEEFAMQREQEAKQLIKELKGQMENLQARVHRFSISKTPAEISVLESKEREREEEEKQILKKVVRRVKKVNSEEGPFDTWRRLNHIKTPKDARIQMVSEEGKNRPKTAYSVYASTHPAHAHEIAFAEDFRSMQRVKRKTKQSFTHS